MISTPSLRAGLVRLLLLGFVAGIMSGLFGVGGGIVLVPGFVLILGMAQHQAHATSLAAILLVAPAAMLGFALEGAVAYGAGALIALGAFAGAYLGAGLMHRMSARRLTQAFSILTVVIAVRLLAGGELAPGDAAHVLDAGRVVGFMLLGLASGTLSALMGVGGGVILVPGMVLLFGFSQHLAEGTSLLVIVPTALMGAWRHARNDYVDWRAGLLCGLGGVTGGVLGAQIALALDAGWLQRLFALFLAVVGVRLLMRQRD